MLNYCFNRFRATAFLSKKHTIYTNINELSGKPFYKFKART